MLNSTPVSYFVLGAFVDLGSLKYMMFVFLLLLYISIVVSNVLLVLVICVDRTLHEPMYLFLCPLFVNEVFGSSALYPLLLAQILEDVHVISTTMCFLQIFVLYSYGGIEFGTLAIMSYDRYLAICRPLQYNSIMTPCKIAALTTLTWFYSIFMNLIFVYVLTPLKLCGNFIPKVYCDNFWVVRLSCSDTLLRNVFGLVNSSCRAVGIVMLILYSYGRILHVCFNSSASTRRKALSTCTPHLISLLNFSCGGLFEIIQSRFNMNAVPMVLRVFLSLYWLSLQPLINPLVYGLKTSKIRLVIRTLLCPKSVM
ncbi:olfactory receptor 6N1-like [Boleophthalmus pectinirostris]|uniref:olfactory receptor 6N1-like n=1 Tax=Boleophthalmus pectinirostris TaxID=150288 RepID=UPI00242B13E1|nr:olfactory receptor 6N1-like [Boleophthalmus pectinirostris]